MAADGWAKETYSKLSSREKRRFLENFACFLRKLHDEGLLVAWPRVADFLAVPGGTPEIRLDPAVRIRRKGRALSDRQRMDFLARLYCSVFPWHSRSVLCRFLKCYLGGERLSRWRESIFRLERRARNLARREKKDQIRLCLFDNREFGVEKRGALRVYFRRNPADRPVLEALLPDPARLQRQGEPLPGRGNSCTSAIVRINGKSYVLKKYHCRGWGYRIRHLFRRSRALRTWVAAWGFRAWGLPLPEPAVCLEERRLGLLGDSYTLTEFVEKARRLSEVWPSVPESSRRTLLARLAILLGRLHRFGGIHGDTNWDNILVSPGGNLYFVDLDGSRMPFRLSFSRARKDIQHVLRDLRRLEPNQPQNEQFFFKIWHRWALPFGSF